MMFSSVKGSERGHKTTLILQHFCYFQKLPKKAILKVCSYSNMVLRKVFLWVFSINLICMNRLEPNS